MSLRNVFAYTIMVCLFAGTGYGQGKDGIKNYFNDAALRVKAASSPQEKREILSTSLSAMSRSLFAVQRSPLISESDRKAVIRFESSIHEKQNELSGAEGYTRVPDEQLNAYADYTVQDVEQAEAITISLLTLILIVILVVLLLR